MSSTDSVEYVGYTEKLNTVAKVFATTPEGKRMPHASWNANKDNGQTPEYVTNRAVEERDFLNKNEKRGWTWAVEVVSQVTSEETWLIA